MQRPREPERLPHQDAAGRLLEAQAATVHAELRLFAEGEAVVLAAPVKAREPERRPSLLHPPEEALEGGVQVVDGVARRAAGDFRHPRLAHLSHEVLAGGLLRPLRAILAEMFEQALYV